MPIQSLKNESQPEVTCVREGIGGHKRGDKIECLDGVSPLLPSCLRTEGCVKVLSGLRVQDVRVLNDAVRLGLWKAKNGVAYSRAEHLQWAALTIMGKNSQAQVYKIVEPWLLLHAPRISRDGFFPCLRILLCMEMADHSLLAKEIKKALGLSSIYLYMEYMYSGGLIQPSGYKGGNKMERRATYILTEKGLKLISLVCDELQRRENAFRQAINTNL
jgi:hypothetical protein